MLPIAVLPVAGAMMVAGCVSVKAPDKPIVIELNINIKQEVVYKLDKGVTDLRGHLLYALPEAESIPIALTINELLTNAVKQSPSAQAIRLHGGDRIIGMAVGIGRHTHKVRLQPRQCLAVIGAQRIAAQLCGQFDRRAVHQSHDLKRRIVMVSQGMAPPHIPQARHQHPNGHFTAPAVIPRINCRENTRYSTNTGTIASDSAASRSLRRPEASK